MYVHYMYEEGTGSLGTIVTIVCDAMGAGNPASVLNY